VGVRSAELTGKKIKVNVKADLSLVREGTVRMALMKAVMACATVDEALSKKVKRQDGEKMSVNATHVKMAVEYGFITLV
jgi:carbon monoxide dehydrogenase subunit G